LDLIVGNYNNSQSGKSTLAYLQNIGDEDDIAFKVIDLDFGGLSNQGNSLGYAPAFADVDGDGDLDLLAGTTEGNIKYLENIAAPGAAASFELNTAFFGQIDAGTYASPFPYDVNGDGRMDLLVGSREGYIRYYRNTGTGSMQLQLEDAEWGG